MEKRVLREHYEVIYTCDMCGNGKMQFVEEITHGRGTTTYYKHECDSCGYIDITDRIYPYIMIEGSTL